jgi:signal transduction histidine kinase
VHPRTGQRGVRITLADTGHGISTEVKDHLFEAFKSTKGSNGSGLGLWISKGIIEKHCGSIQARSSTKPGCSGTVFSIFLPVSE